MKPINELMVFWTVRGDRISGSCIVDCGKKKMAAVGVGVISGGCHG